MGTGPLVVGLHPGSWEGCVTRGSGGEHLRGLWEMGEDVEPWGPAEKVSWTFHSWITSETRECGFSLKRPLYSSSHPVLGGKPEWE